LLASSLPGRMKTLSWWYAWGGWRPSVSLAAFFSTLGLVFDQLEQSSSTVLGLNKKMPVVMCPGCDRRMKPIDEKPIMFTEGLVDVTYFCERCRMRTIRTVRLDNPDDPRVA
jgi:hypothetical protein